MTSTGGPVLITGGTGFIGAHVVARGMLREAELHVLTRARPMAGAQAWICDLADQSGLRVVLEKVRPLGILHLAAGGVAYGTGALADLVQVNAVGLAALLDAASRLPKLPAIVVAGSGFEYAPRDRPLQESDVVEPTNGYGASKAAATHIARLFADRMPVTVLRLFSVFGPGERDPRLAPHVIAQARKHAPVELTAGEQLRDYVYVEDIAEAFWRALDVGPSDGRLRVMNVGTGRQVTVRAFVETVARSLARRGYAPDLRFGAKPYRADEPSCYLPELTFMRQCLSWTPPTSLEDGIERMVEATIRDA